MGLFDQFPYTNFHELNLDWILQALKEIEHTIDQFVAINALKYADPIQWDITSQYEKNTIVIDPQTGTAYISVQPVPIGVSLTNPDYWTVVFDLGSFVTRAAKNFTVRWEEDTTLTATFNTTAGQWLVWGDTLYKANVNITAGDSYVVDGNITRITVEEVKDQILQLISDNYDAIISMIGDLDDLTTAAKNTLVAAINELVSTAAALQTSIDNEATARTNADTTLQNNIDTVSSDLADETSARESADTTLQNNIDGVSSDLAAETSARQSADAALNDRIDRLAITGKDVILISDSYGVVSANPTRWSWFTKFQSLTDVNVYTKAAGGASFGGGNQGVTYIGLLTDLIGTLTDEQKSNIGTVIIGGGYNDALYTVSESDFAAAVTAFKTLCDNSFPYLDEVLFCFIANDYSGVQEVNTKYVNVNKFYFADWMGKLSYYCNLNDIRYSEIPYIYFHNYNYMQSDGIHPNATGADMIGVGVFSAYKYNSNICANIDTVFSFTGSNVSNVTDASMRMLLSSHGVNVNNGSFQCTKAASNSDPAIFVSNTPTAILPRTGILEYTTANIGQYTVVCEMYIEPYLQGKLKLTLTPVTSATWQTLTLTHKMFTLDPLHT